MKILSKIFTRKLTFSKDLLITIINTLGIIAGVFILNAYIARVFGIEILGEYLYIRRVVYSSIGIFLVGTNIGLPYYLAKNNDVTYGASSAWIFIFITIPLLAVLIFIFNVIDIEIFSQELLFSIFIYAVGANSMNLVIGLYRGYLFTLGAAIINFVGSIVFPVLGFIFFKDLSVILIFTGITIFAGSTIVFFSIEKNSIRNKICIKEILILLKYGLNRILSFVSQTFLIAGVPIILYSEIEKTSLAYLTSSISLIRLTLIIIGPIGFVILPRLSKVYSDSNKSKIKENLEALFSSVLYFGFIGMYILLFYGPLIIKIWLGEINSDGILISKFISISIPFFMITSAFRSVIDSISKKGYNSLIYSISAIILVVTFTGATLLNYSGVTAGVISFITGYFVSTLLTIIITKNILGYSILTREHIITILNLSFFSVCIYGLIRILPVNSIIELLLFILSISIYTILLFLKSNKKWISQLRLNIKNK